MFRRPLSPRRNWGIIRYVRPNSNPFSIRHARSLGKATSPMGIVRVIDGHVRFWFLDNIIRWGNDAGILVGIGLPSDRISPLLARHCKNRPTGRAALVRSTPALCEGDFFVECHLHCRCSFRPRLDEAFTGDSHGRSQWHTKKSNGSGEPSSDDFRNDPSGFDAGELLIQALVAKRQSPMVDSQ